MATLSLSDAQAAGDACVSCGKPGLAADGQRVGTCGDATIWACFEGCAVLVSILHGGG